MPAYKFAVPRSRGAIAAEAVGQDQPVQAAASTPTSVNGLVVLASIGRIAFSDQDVEELVATLTNDTLDLSTPQDRLDALTNNVVIGPKLRQFFGWMTRVAEEVDVVVAVSGAPGSVQQLTPSMTTVLADAGLGSFTLDMAAAAVMPGKTVTIKKIDTTRNGVTIQSSDTIDGELSITLDVPYEAVQLISSGAAWYII